MNSAVAGVLNKVLGDFLENLDSNQLNLSIFSGTIDLQQLRIKAEALDMLGFPFELKYGFVGKIHVEIPWTSLTSSPLKIELIDVFVQLATKPIDDWRDEQQASLMAKAKKSALESFEVLNKPELKVEASPGYIEQMATKIIDNVQVIIKGIYIRLDDQISSIHPYSIGIVLGGVEAKTCNSRWKPEYIVDSPITYKLARVEFLSVFIDSGEDTIKHAESRKFPKLARNEVEGSGPDHQYLISPLELTIKVELNKNPKNLAIPQAKIEMTECALQLKTMPMQITHVLKLLEFYSNFDRFKQGVAASLPREELNERSAHQYRDAYKRWLKGDAKTKDKLKGPLEGMERDVEVQHIIAQRSLALKEIDIELQEEAKQKQIVDIQAGASEGYFSGVSSWFGGGKSEADKKREEAERNAKIAVINQEISSLQASKSALSSDYSSLLSTSEVFGVMPPDYVRFLVKVNVPLISFSIASDKRTMIEYRIRTVVIEAGLRPTSIYAKVDIEGSEIQDLLQESQYYPDIFRTGKLELTYDQRPAQKLRVRLGSIFFVANVRSLVEVLVTLQTSVLKEFDASKYRKKAASIAETYVLAGKEYMQSMIVGDYEPKHIILDIAIESPQLVFPEDINSEASFIVIELGSLKASSKQAKAPKGVDLKTLTNDEQLYDVYTFEVTDANIQTSANGLKSTLLHKTSVRNTIETCIVKEHPLKPALKVTSVIGEIKTGISDTQLLQLLNIKDATLKVLDEKMQPSQEQEAQKVVLSEDSRVVRSYVALVAEFKITRFEFGLFKQAEQLLKAEMEDLQTRVSLKTDSELEVDLGLRKLQMRDMRQGTYFNKIFYNPAKGTTQLRVQALLKPREEITEVILDMNDFRVVLCPETLSAIMDFAKLQGETIQKSSKPKEQSAESEVVAVQPRKEKLSMPGLGASLKILNFEVWLPMSSNQAGCEVLSLGLSSVVNFSSEQHINYRLTSKNVIISSDLKFKDNEANAEIMQFSIKSGIEKDGSLDDPKPLFRPCRLSLSFNDFKRDGIETQDISLNVEAISLGLGFRDLVHFKSLGSKWSALSPDISEQSVKETETVSLAKPSAAFSEVRRDIKMQCDSVKITLDNDTDDFAYALVMVQVSNLGASILQHTGLEVNATIAFDASYYNTKVNTWEPLIEPYALELSVAQVSPAEQMQVKVATPEVFNFNVTFSLLEALMTITKRISQGEDQWALVPSNRQDSEDQASGPEFLFVNNLGEDIELFLDADPEKTKQRLENGKTWTMVGSEMSAQLSAGSNSYNLSTIVGAVKPPFTVSFKLKDNLKISAVNIEEVKASGFELANSTREVSVVVDVTSKKSSNYIRLSSNLVVMNNTEFDIELINADTRRVVAKSKTWSLPLPWTVGGTSLEVDIEPLVLAFKVEPTPRYAKIQGRWVSIDTLQVSAGEGSFIVMQVNPVVTFINLLPGRLSIFKQETELCSLETGKELGAYSLNPTEVSSLSFKLQIDATHSLNCGVVSLPEIDEVSYNEIRGTVPAEKVVVGRCMQSFMKNDNFNLKYRKVTDKSLSSEALSFYTEYLIVNRTDFNMELGRGQEIISLKRHSFGLYSSERREVRLRLIGDEYGNPTEWSKDFNIATSGVAGTVNLKNALAHSSNPEAPTEVEFGILITEAAYPLVKTKLVQLLPRFILNNSLDSPIYVRQFEQTRVITIQAKTKQVLNLTEPTAKRSIQISEDSKSWSSPFNIEEVEDFVMKVTSSARGTEWHEPGPHNYFQRFLRLAVSTQNDATLFINVLTPSDPEFMISNLTNETLEINQLNCSSWQVGPQTCIPYAYDNLLDKDKKVLVRAGLHTNKYSLEKVKTQKPLGNFMVALVVKGVRRVLEVCEPDLQKVVEAGLSETLSKVEIEVEMAGLGISIIDEEPKEVLYFSMRKLVVKASVETLFSKDTLEYKQGLTLNIGRIQIDNMLTHKSAFPVLFSPKATAEETETENVPFFQMNVHKSSVKPLFLQEIGTMDRFRMVGLLVQEMQVQVDMQTVMQLLEVVNSVQEITGKALTQHNADDIYKIVPELQADQPDTLMSAETATRKSYFEVFQLSAIKLLLSFKMPGKKIELQLDPRSGFGLFRILSNVGVHLASFSNSPLYFKNLIFFSSFQTVQTLTNLITKNYIRQGILQFYKILGSSDILGNPIGLIDNLGTGVVEFFSEPYKGMLKGPGEFAGGLAKGVKSLIGNVISGSFGSISKITGSLYNVVREVGGDEEGADRLKQSDNVVTGLYDGVKGGVTDLAEGISGLFTKPYQGAKKEGVVGFFKGVGSGLLGVVTSPFSAVLRIGSSVASGIANTGEFLKNGKISQNGRVRFPRHFSSSRVLTPYNEELAEAQEWLRVNKEFKHEHLVLFLKFQRKTMALLTERTLIILFQGEVERSVSVLDITKCEVHRVQLDYYLCCSMGLTELVIKSKDFNKLAKLYLTVSSMPTKIVKTDKLSKLVVPARYSRTCC
jgi:vacuolar protein sorting-associated protein 13A/C